MVHNFRGRRDGSSTKAEQYHSLGRTVGRDLIVYYCPEMCPIRGVFSLFYGRGIFRFFGQPRVVGRSVHHIFVFDHVSIPSGSQTWHWKILYEWRF